PNGIIVGFDADSKCDPDYFEAIWAHFSRHPKSPAASIYFEHPLLGVDFEEGVYRAIVWYELHLRYYIDAQKWAGFPFATQTIGSSLAVRCRDYQAQGGMNRRKAGEDFYFLHKFTPLGHFGEITETRVIPSPRPSHRVPFGTGRAVQAALRQNGEWETYAPESFRDLRHFFDRVPDFFEASKSASGAILSTLPEPVQLFLESNKFNVKLAEIQSNTRQRCAFTNRFFKWMNAFMVMKFLHFSRDNYYPNVPVSEAARWLLSEAGMANPIPEDPAGLLAIYREKDRRKYAWR
ncbi:MAG: glycosyltransferase family 2 protein, partial [Bacteroidetes bacterium]